MMGPRVVVVIERGTDNPVKYADQVLGSNKNVRELIMAFGIITTASMWGDMYDEAKEYIDRDSALVIDTRQPAKS